jgi:hypothetical protein
LNFQQQTPRFKYAMAGIDPKPPLFGPPDGWAVAFKIDAVAMRAGGPI